MPDPQQQQNPQQSAGAPPPIDFSSIGGKPVSAPATQSTAIDFSSIGGKPVNAASSSGADFTGGMGDQQKTLEQMYIKQGLPPDVANRHARQVMSKYAANPSFAAPVNDSENQGIVANLASGVGKEAAKTVVGAASLASHVVPGGAAIRQGIASGDPAALETHGVAQGLGSLAEQVTEFAGGEEALSGLVKLAKTPAALLELLEKYPKASKVILALAKPAVKAAVVGVAQGALKGAEEGDAIKGAETGAEGGAIGGGLSALMPKGLTILPKSKLNAAEKEAVEFGMKEGVPVSAGTASGNKAVQGTEFLADRSLLGAGVAGDVRNKTAKALTETGEEIAGKVSPSPQVPESAGGAVQKSLNTKIASLKKEADKAYDAFRARAAGEETIPDLEAQKPEFLSRKAAELSAGRDMNAEQMRDSFAREIANDKELLRKNPTKEEQSALEVRIAQNQEQLDALKSGAAASKTGGGQGNLITVDIKQIKQDLAPVVANMEKWMEPAKLQASSGYRALKSIIEGEDVIPADQAEIGLSGLKSLAREGADNPNLKNVNQGLGGMAAGKLQTEIDLAVSKADPEAMKALQAGRSAHAQKMRVAETLESLRDEPVQAFNQLTMAKDAGIDQLREVAKVVPEEMPKLGRAYLDDMLTKATSEGGFDKQGTLLAKWNTLGPESKIIMFPNPQHVKDLDNFFLLAKKLGENPNPSGTAYVTSLGGQIALIFTHPGIGVPTVLAGGALSKLLHSNAGAKAALEGLRVSLPAGTKAATSAVTSVAFENLLKEAKKTETIPDEPK